MNSDRILRMPWTQLTDLTLTNGHVAQLSFDIFAQCTNLVMASITTDGWNIAAHVPPNIITMDHLRVLVLRFFSRLPEASYFMPFFNHISAPRLQKLTLNLKIGFSWDRSQFTAFQLRSPGIIRLAIRHSDMNTNDLGDTLLHTPALTELILEYCPRSIDNSLLQALSYKDNAFPLVPCLHRVGLLLSGSAVSADYLAEMIAFGWWSDSELLSRSAPPAIARWTLI